MKATGTPPMVQPWPLMDTRNSVEDATFLQTWVVHGDGAMLVERAQCPRPCTTRLCHHSAAFQCDYVDVLLLRRQHQLQRRTPGKRRYGDIQRADLQLLPLLRLVWPLGQHRRLITLRSGEFSWNGFRCGTAPLPFWPAG